MSDPEGQSVEPFSAELAPGSLIATRFRVDKVLGDGASGVVYLAECVEEPEPGESAPLRMGQRVALKVIHRHLAKDKQISRRFDREARILRKLRSPNLVPLLDFGQIDGLLYMALEHVEGTPLDVLAKRERMSPERAVDIVRQICCALTVAHEAGVIHRDLKPGNVIVQSAEGEADTIRVLDFGLAKVLRADASQSLTALTQQNMVFGTPEYMAPEQARGDDVDERCDVYAAGIILYELLTGSVPFTGNNPINIMTAQLVEVAEPPSSRAKDAGIPPALDAVVKHALAKSPADRYPSASALATALSLALRRPRDVASAAPPPPDEEIGTRDTELSLDQLGAPPVPQPVPQPAPAEPRARTGYFFIAVVIIAALIGIAAGLGLGSGSP